MLAAGSLGLAACSGGSKPPSVASLGNAGGSRGTTTTTLPRGTPTQLLDQWAACMRQHGDPSQTDPVVDANGVIHITAPPTAGQVFKTSQNPCQSYLTAASTALGGKSASQSRPDYHKMLAFSRCMRAHGIADFPDPSAGGGLSIRVHPGSDLSPNSPTFQSAQKTCAKATGVPAFASDKAQAGAIQITGSGGPGPGPAGGPAGGGGGEIVGDGPGSGSGSGAGGLGGNATTGGAGS